MIHEKYFEELEKREKLILRKNEPTSFLRKYHTITEAKNGAGAVPIKTDRGWNL